MPNGPPPALAQDSDVSTSSEYKRVRRKKKQGPEAEALVTFGGIGGMLYWGYTTSKAADKEEAIRIRKETEKMEKMSKEFTNIDEEVSERGSPFLFLARPLAAADLLLAPCSGPLA